MSSKEERKKSMQAKKERKRAVKEAKREAMVAGEDFWESHNDMREGEYRLPPQNRKSISLARAVQEEEEGGEGDGAGEGW
jgi:hypothetical protein